MWCCFGTAGEEVRGWTKKGHCGVGEGKREESGRGKKGLERKSTRCDQLDDLSRFKYSQSRKEERRSSSDNDDNTKQLVDA